MTASLRMASGRPVPGRRLMQDVRFGNYVVVMYAMAMHRGSPPEHSSRIRLLPECSWRRCRLWLENRLVERAWHRVNWPSLLTRTALFPTCSTTSSRAVAPYGKDQGARFVDHESETQFAPPVSVTWARQSRRRCSLSSSSPSGLHPTPADYAVCTSGAPMGRIHNQEPWDFGVYFIVELIVQ